MVVLAILPILLLSWQGFALPNGLDFPEFYNAQTTTAVDWSQPPAACVEEVVPTMPDRACLNLRSVNDPRKDFPSLPPAELTYWKNHLRPLQFCRAQEVLRRESVRPGSFSDAVIEISWMQVQAVQDSEWKIAAVYKASRDLEIPAQILAGALYQESIYTDLGIAEDGANYSCGTGQVNLIEWCRWASDQSVEKKMQMDWPLEAGDCAQLKPILLKPFYDIAVTRLAGLPEYKMTKAQFQNISLADVVAKFPEGDTDTQALRYQAARSFINNCSDPKNGIPAKAHELRHLYDELVPPGLQSVNRYKPGDKFQKSCREEGYIGAYPFHIGWLLTVGAYNAGGKAFDSMAYYNRISYTQAQSQDTWKNITPKDIVFSLYWSGAYNKITDKINFTAWDNSPAEWNWFKLCVLQRHLARVVQHSTAVGIPSPVDSLEGANPCAKSVFDANGKLVKSGVPAERQTSSGQIPLE